MPALVNYSGDDEFYSGGSFCPNPMELGRLCSMDSHVDVFSPPCKRARIAAPFSFEGAELEQDKKPSIDALPDECLFEIFRRLEGGKERSRSACVSKRWLMLMSSIRRSEICVSKSIVDDPVSADVEMASCTEDGELEGDGYLSRCLEGKRATDMRLAAIAVGTASCGGLGKLAIRSSNSIRGITNRGLSVIARGCPSLKVLSFWNVSTVGDEGLSEIAGGCNLLERLDLYQCPAISDKGLIAIAERCHNLTALTIESCPKIGNEGLRAVGRLCPKLQSICIKDCPLVGDRGVSSMLSSAPSLAKVRLQVLNVTDFSLAVIGHYGKSVTNLVLNGLQNVTEKGFWVMGNALGLQKLVSLTITSCRGITDASLEALGKGCTSLKQMCLNKCCFVSDSGLIAFVNGARRLESLHLEECNRISQLGVISALSSNETKLKSLSLTKCMGLKDLKFSLPMSSPCKSVRSLSIKYCPGFGSASLAMMGKLCPQLQNLDVSGLYGVTDLGLLSLLESCEAGLVKVNLSGCLNLTDESVLALCRLHGGTIELLNLDGCRKVTDSSLAGITENCLFLTDLDVSKCAITDSGVAALSSTEQLNLQILSISGCTKVSNKSIPFLKKLGETLIGLNLQHCKSISSRNIDLLVESLWRCDILS